MEDLSKMALGALFGAGVTFVFGVLRTRLDDRRKRDAIATALLTEQGRLRTVLSRFTQEEIEPVAVGFAFGYLASPVHDQFVENVPLFKPPTVHLLLEFTHELNRFRQCFGTPTAADAFTKEQHAHLRRHARQALHIQSKVEPLLLAEGGEVVPTSASLHDSAKLRAILAEVVEENFALGLIDKDGNDILTPEEEEQRRKNRAENEAEEA